MRRIVVILLAFSICALPQNTLSLRDAAKIALEKHPSIEAALERIKAAEQRIEQARSGRLPKVNYSESFARSNNPVFVFSSLLTQRQFTEQNFQVESLIHPDFLNNFQSLITVDQTLYDHRRTQQQIQSAEMGRQVAAEERRSMEMRVVAGVVRAYAAVLLSDSAAQTAQSAVRSAEADLEKAESIRQVGMSTDADVLSIRVHLSAMREQLIRRKADARIARMALNEVLGLPLETDHQLSTPLTPAPKTASADLVKTALAQRPELVQSKLAVQMAESQAVAAKSSLWPEVALRGAFEADRQRFVNRGGSNWLLGVNLRWNLFNGFADRARIQEAAHSIRAAKASERQVQSGVSLEMRRAEADLDAARERIGVAESAIAMAEESLRIMKNRYENGLSTVTDLLRNETAVLDAQTRRLLAIHDHRVAAAALELAAGTLSAHSEVLE